MKRKQARRADRQFAAGGVLLCVAGLSVALGLPGCGGKVESQVGAETYDEYTQALTDAVIGTPSGVLLIDADGGVIDAGTSGGGPAADGGTVDAGLDSGGSDASSKDGSGGAVGDDASGGPVGDGGSGGGSGDAGAGGGFGSWRFDDCSPTSNFLIDSSGEGHDAQHALGAACVPGISGLGVGFRSAKDVVQVPDEPQFTLESRVAVAAWVHPTTVSGNQPIVIKRDKNHTSFSLGIHSGNIEMSVVLTTGQTIISRAPIAAGTWTHVAGMYDGTFLFLFVDGQQFGQVFAAGTLRNELAPIRIGATTQTQHFDGVIDEVFVSTQAISKDALTALSCIGRPSTLAVSPTTSGPVPVNTTVHYDVSVSDNDIGACQPRSYDIFRSAFDSNFGVVFDPPGTFQDAGPGETVTFGTNVTATETADPGVHDLAFTVDDFTRVSPFQSARLPFTLRYEVAAPTGCFVSTRRELMITSTSVVDDPVRTARSNAGGPVADAGAVPLDAVTAPPPFPLPPALVTNPSAGVWTFGHLMQEMAPTPADAPAMALKLFQHWLTDQTVNNLTVLARPAMQQVLLDLWPKTSTGELDMDRAPMTLQAIVNRIDLRDLTAGSAGEGRFVFAVNGAFGFPQQFTVILEYNLPAKTSQDVKAWADRWHALGSLPFPSEEYNAALEAITRSFAGRNASPGSPNGSALLSLRTNEIALSNVRWELRQFDLSPDTGLLREIPVGETPDIAFNGTATFADFVNAKETAILALLPGATGNTVPPLFEGNDFQGGSALNGTNPFTPVAWSAPGIKNPEARFHASINTCNGCHGPDTNTAFLQVSPRAPGSEASLSPFLTGTTVTDRFSGQLRTLNDLARRNTDLTALVCPNDGGTTPPDASPPPDLVDASPPPDFVDASPPPDLVDASPPPDLVDANPPPDLVDASPPAADDGGLPMLVVVPPVPFNVGSSRSFDAGSTAD